MEGLSLRELAVSIGSRRLLPSQETLLSEECGVPSPAPAPAPAPFLILLCRT